MTDYLLRPVLDVTSFMEGAWNLSMRGRLSLYYTRRCIRTCRKQSIRRSPLFFHWVFMLYFCHAFRIVWLPWQLPARIANIIPINTITDVLILLIINYPCTYFNLISCLQFPKPHFPHQVLNSHHSMTICSFPKCDPCRWWCFAAQEWNVISCIVSGLVYVNK